MTFRASLRRQSAVWHLWERLNRLGGLVCGVQFTRVAPGSYVTEALDTEQVKVLRAHSDVLVEAMTVPLAVVPAPIEPAQMVNPVHNEINNYDFFQIPKPEPKPQPSIEERRKERLKRLDVGRKKSNFDKYGSA